MDKKEVTKPKKNESAIPDSAKAVFVKMLSRSFPKNEEICTSISEAFAECHSEESLSEFKSSSQKFVLKLKKNKALQEKLINKEIDCETVARMKPEELDTDDVKKLVKKIDQEIVDKNKPRDLNTVPDGDYPCPRCRSLKQECNLRQMRSADEPMTRCYYCLACGYEWKRSC